MAGRADAYESIFIALAHPARRRIVMTLHFEGGSMTAGAIAKIFAHAWPTTTRHLQVLQTAGLVQQMREGRARRYTIDRDRLALARDWLAQLIGKERHANKEAADRKEVGPKKRTARKGGRRAAAVPPQRRGRRPR